MRVLRVGPLPEDALEAAAEFHGRVVPELLGELGLVAPPRNGEGDHAEHGGGVGAADPHLKGHDKRHVPLHHPAGGPPPPVGEALVLVFAAASHEQRSWRLAAVQDLARAAAPVRVNGIAGDDEAAINEAVAFLANAPGITGQLLAVDPG